MARFRIARLLGAVLTISVMTGSVALPAMAAEEIRSAAEAAQETGEEGTTDTEETTEEQQAEEESAGKPSEEHSAEEREEENADAGNENAEAVSTQKPAESAQCIAAQEQVQDQDTQAEADPAENSPETESAETDEIEPDETESDETETEGEETLPVLSAETSVSEESVTDAAKSGKEAPLTDEQGELTAENGNAANVAKEGVQAYEMDLRSSSDAVTVGQTATVTATITFTAPSEESFDMTAEAAAGALSWQIDASGAAAITQASEVQTVKNRTGAQESGGGTAAEEGAAPDETVSEKMASEEMASEETVVYSGSVTQTVTVRGVAEGTAGVTAAAGEESRSVQLKVNPVPVQLGQAANLYWRDTTVLTWDKVKNAGQYRVVISVYEGNKSYAGVIMTSANSCDAEDKIVALIRNYKASFTGASYSVKASVQAISKDTVHFKNGAAASAPGMRYLDTTYREALSRNGWFQKGGEWYFYEAGVKQTGWFGFSGKKYYFYADGRMAHDCWIGKKYLKSNGEMARDEWVAGYKYYVDKNGDKADKSTFVTKFFYKTAKGWHYKRTNGKPEFKNTWASIFNRMYYFDEGGNIKTGFFTVAGKRYFADYTGTPVTGLGARRTGWITVPSGTYWLDDNGVMQRSAWVDKKQYYVDAGGHRCDWITYNNLRNVNTSNRLGYYIGSSGSAPEQSIAAYDAAYKNGNRIMVVDLRFTKDNVPVCFHDDLVGYARYKNGDEPGSRPSVSKSTLSQLNNYDYGIKWGNQYKGTKVLTLEQMAAWIAKHSDTELYIEVKVDSMNAEQIKKTAAVLNKYKVMGNSSMIFGVSSASDTRAQRVHNAAPSLRIGFTTSAVNDVAVAQIKKAKGARNEVFLWCWDKTGLTASKVKTLRALDVQYECGTFSTLDQILKYYAKGSAYSYNSGVETDGAAFHQMLRAATMHEKAKWVKTAKGWQYRLASGNYVRSQWRTISGKRYYFTADAVMKTGWMSKSGKMYYFDSNGVMAIGTKTIGGHVYKFGTDGVFIKKIK
ncbi:MAG: hypothetical protein IJ198_02855 [Lachnospiraceae bacterium]|nr:hypothetical protein [Lachnospiraceae bacterium]